MSTLLLRRLHVPFVIEHGTPRTCRSVSAVRMPAPAQVHGEFAAAVARGLRTGPGLSAQGLVEQSAD
jgi:hypothetical protein